VVAYAWLEVEGYPLELTQPWHTPHPYEAVYFGAEVPDEDVRSAISQAEQNNGSLPTPLSATEEIREQLQSDQGMKAVNRASR